MKRRKIDKYGKRYTEIMKWEWKIFQWLARIKCLYTKHRYDVIKYSSWDRMEWQCSKCGIKLVWVRDIV